MIMRGFVSILCFRGFLPAAVFASGCLMAVAQTPAGEDDIRPAKGMVEIPTEAPVPVALWLAVASGVVVAVLVWVWWRFFRGKKGKRPEKTALSALEILAAQSGAASASAFATDVAGVLRQYIADRFGLAAPRRTTEEFLRDVEYSPILAEGDHLRGFLKSCDLAKFAGSGLDSAQREDLIRTARAFVMATAKPDSRKP